METLEPETNSGDWSEIITFYQNIISEAHWPFKPMLDLAQELSLSVAGRTLYPSLSHEHLGFSLVPDYPQRRELPQVWVHYQSQNHTFEITFREYMGGPQEKTVCGPLEVRIIVEQVLTRLLGRKAKLPAN